MYYCSQRGCRYAFGWLRSLDAVELFMQPYLERQRAMRQSRRRRVLDLIEQYNVVGLNASAKLMGASGHLRDLGHPRLAEVLKAIYLDDLKVRAESRPMPDPATMDRLQQTTISIRSAAGLSVLDESECAP